jgi:F420-non-reducing hydrogenase iron-sulfur subunit
MGKPLDIVVFSCNWDGLSCIEAAACARLSYPASVKTIRVSCLSRVHIGLILTAFELGAAGVMLLGCKTGKCHYDIESRHVAREIEKAQGILRLTGFGPGKVTFAQVSRADGPGFVDQVKAFFASVESAEGSAGQGLIGRRGPRWCAHPGGSGGRGDE